MCVVSLQHACMQANRGVHKRRGKKHSSRLTANEEQQQSIGVTAVLGGAIEDYQPNQQTGKRMIIMR